jgi:hypothetical protein
MIIQRIGKPHWWIVLFVRQHKLDTRERRPLVLDKGLPIALSCVAADTKARDCRINLADQSVNP